MLILTALFGDFVCYLCPPVFCSIADFGLWLWEASIFHFPFVGGLAFPSSQAICFCIPGLGDAQVTTGMNLAWVNHLCSPTILSFGNAQPALTFQLLRLWLFDIQQKMSSGYFWVNYKPWWLNRWMYTNISLLAKNFYETMPKPHFNNNSRNKI